eukprot:7261863-Alexandrium_andersonii.AAC.1
MRQAWNTACADHTEAMATWRFFRTSSREASARQYTIVAAGTCGRNCSRLRPSMRSWRRRSRPKPSRPPYHWALCPTSPCGIRASVGPGNGGRAHL